MADDLAELRSYLDGLYTAVASAAPRRADLVSAALNAIYAAARSDADLERAFGHLLAARATEAQSVAAVPPAPPADQFGMPPKVYLYGDNNPKRSEALAREGT